MTRVRELLEDLAHRFGEAGLVFGHGTDNAWDEAVALVLGVTRLPDDPTTLDHPLTPAWQARVESLARRRIDERVPLPYLLGRCHFAGREFLIERGIVIPRSPIGGLAQQRFAPWLKAAPERILDLCCGCGCIGIAAALQFPQARLVLSDVDPRAVELATRNVALHGLQDRAQLLHSDLFAGLGRRRWDLIISNPPYVDQTDMASLPPEHRHEPALGLAGGADGLDLVARMIAALPDRLRPGGTFICEVGASAPALLRRFPGTDFVWPDLPDGGQGVFLLWASAAAGNAG